MTNNNLMMGTKAGVVLTCLLLSGWLPGAPAASSRQTADGRPDLEGTWTNASLTFAWKGRQSMVTGPSCRSRSERTRKKNKNWAALGNKPTDPNASIKDLPADCSGGRVNNCNYNAAWTDPGTTVMRVNGEPRSSFITSPDNGHIPAYTPEAIANGSAVRRYGPPLPAGLGQNDNPETRALGERA